MKLFGRKEKIEKEAQQKAEKEELVKALGLEKEANRCAVSTFALDCAVSLIAGLVSKCEFRTFSGYKPVRQSEYWLWNYRPNPVENSTQFIQNFISKLLYKNEALVFPVGRDLFVADSFQKQEYALKETVFYDILRKDLILNRRFCSSEVLYFKLNDKNIARHVSGIQASYDNLISEAVDRYMKSGGDKLILNIESLAENDPHFSERITAYMNDYFKKYFESKNAVLPLFEGFSISQMQNGETKKSDEASGIVSLKKEAMDLAAQMFKIPPAILRGDVADVSVLVDNLLTFCIDPLCCQIEEEITSKRYTPEEFAKGNYLSVDTTAIKHLDIFSMAANVDKLIGCGFYNIDEVREKAGEHRLNTEFSNQYVRTKNYAVEGGENE